MKKKIYLLMSILGLTIPYYFLISFFIENGFKIDLLLQQVFQTKGSTFFAVDVIISAFVLVFFILEDYKKQNVKFYWIPILGTFTVGVSFGLPLYLYLREKE